MNNDSWNNMETEEKLYERIYEELNASLASLVTYKIEALISKEDIDEDESSYVDILATKIARNICMNFKCRQK